MQRLTSHNIEIYTWHEICTPN